MSKRKKSDAVSSKEAVRVLKQAGRERIWLVVADACHARILEGDLDHSGVALVLQAAAPRVSGAARSRAHLLRRGAEHPERHVIAPLKNLKAHEMQVFFSRLADYLAGSAARFDGLVLIAPARVQQQMTKSLPKAVLDKVVERHKEDLTWMPAGGILEHLGSLGKQMQRQRVPANPLPFLKRRKSA